VERSNLTPRGRTAAPAGADPATPTEADPRTAEAGAATSRRAAILLGLGAAAGAFAAIAGVRLAERTGDGRREITAAGGLLPDGPLSTGSAWSGRRRREAGWSSRTAAPDSATGGSSTAGPSAPEPASPGGRSATGPKSTPLGTAGPSGSSPAPANALQFFGSAENRQVYLTIDDGWFPDARVVDLIRAERLPITTFLIANAGDEDPERLAFWRSFVDAGGVVENHTVSHPWLTRLRPGEIEAQWEGASTAFAKWFGRRPTLGRPPYGAVDDPVWTAAENAGLTTLVMWSAVDDGHGVATWNHRPLAAGDIVLMHWDPGLFRELQQVLAAISDAGLRPAFLSPA
jgi:peptidoglycan/xylan/chitin deacetylase (PgdA/CDA1 family)